MVAIWKDIVLDIYPRQDQEDMIQSHLWLQIVHGGFIKWDLLCFDKWKEKKFLQIVYVLTNEKKRNFYKLFMFWQMKRKEISTNCLNRENTYTLCVIFDFFFTRMKI
jgi:hypothetical protein